MVVVNEMGKRYGVAIGEGSDKVTLIFSQLDFHSRNKITNISTELNGAMVTLNLGLSCFYTLKYGLKDVRGFKAANGDDYKLEYEEGLDELTDKCVNELLASPLEESILFSARELGANVPAKIVHPITKQPLEGVEIIPPEKLQGVLEKK